MRLMPSLPGRTLPPSQSFHSWWSSATLFWVEADQRSHSSAFGAASAASEAAIRAMNARRRMAGSGGLPLGPRVGQMIREPGQQVRGDLITAGFVEQFEIGRASCRERERIEESIMK